MDRPSPWTPCNYSEEALEELGLDEGRREFALRRRLVTRRLTFYRNGTGPSRASEGYLAGPIRGPDPYAPCEVSWLSCDSSRPRWIEGAPAPRFDCLRAFAPWMEAVSFEREEAPPVWIVGEAFWSFDREEGTILRWTERDGLTTHGEGDVRDFSLVAEEEWSMDYRTPPGRKPFWKWTLEKRMVRLRIEVDRAPRRPLAVSTLLVDAPGPEVGS